MSRYLFALGGFSFRHRWLVLGTWLAVLVGVALAFVGFRGDPHATTSPSPARSPSARSSSCSRSCRPSPGPRPSSSSPRPQGRAITDPAVGAGHRPGDRLACATSPASRLAARTDPDAADLAGRPGRAGHRAVAGADRRGGRLRPERPGIGDATGPERRCAGRVRRQRVPRLQGRRPAPARDHRHRRRVPDPARSPSGPSSPPGCRSSPPASAWASAHWASSWSPSFLDMPSAALVAGADARTVLRHRLRTVHPQPVPQQPAAADAARGGGRRWLSGLRAARWCSPR